MLLDFTMLTLANKSLDVDFSLLQSFVQHDPILIIFCALDPSGSHTYRFVILFSIAVLWLFLSFFVKLPIYNLGHAINIQPTHLRTASHDLYSTH